MIKVEEAGRIILGQVKSYGTESIYFENALGRVLAADVYADRDLPPYNRSTMDGIAIQFAAFEHGIRTFTIQATQAAGENPADIYNEGNCIEIMTGAALPSTADTIVRYEDLAIQNGKATITAENITKGQNIHLQGRDKTKGAVAAQANQYISPAIIQLAAAVGATELAVKKLPKTVIISSGDELVEVNETPLPYQIRKSNNYTIKAVLKQHNLHAGMLHIPDDAAITKQQISKCLQQYDVIILTGGISMGRFDYIPQALEDCAVKKLFHKVQQRPGKPFWFGRHDSGVLVFAFPGNPVSTFMCLHRYFLPWLQQSLGIPEKPLYAALDKDFTFTPALQYFLQVKLYVNNQAQLLASPVAGNGSGDFANLESTDAFMELPLERDKFTQGEVFRVWKW